MKGWQVRVAVLAATTLAASGCTLGERTKHADALVASPERAAAAGTAVGTMTFALSVKPAGDQPAGQGGLPTGGGLPNVTPPPTGEVPIAVDFTRRAASISLAATGGTPEPAVVIDGTRMFVRRGSTTGISSRRWVVLDLADIEEVPLPEPNDVGQRTGLLLVAFPGPLQLIELLAGSLTGSTEQAGPNRFAANLSREKADRELGLDDEAKERRTQALRFVAALDEVHPAKATLDAEGRPTDFEVRLRPRLRRDFDVEVRVGTRLTYEPATVTIPAPDDTLVLETQGQLLAELVSLGRALTTAPGEGEAEA